MRSGRSGLTLAATRLEWRLFADILKVGLPTAINAVQTNLCVILVTGAVGLFGTAALAGYGTASRLDYVMIPILFGLSSAVLTMVGINVGAGTYLRTVGFLYGLYGFGFVMSFAAQGAGKILWPTVAVTARLVVSAGLGWLAVTSFGGTMHTLTLIVAASFVVYAGFAGLVMVQRSAWRSKAR